MNPLEKTELVSRYIDGTLSEPEIAGFETQLQKDPELADLLCKLSMQHVLLGRLAKDTAAGKNAPDVPSTRRMKRVSSTRLRKARAKHLSPAVWLVPLAAAAAVVLAFVLLSRPAGPPEAPSLARHKPSPQETPEPVTFEPDIPQPSPDAEPVPAPAPPVMQREAPAPDPQPAVEPSPEGPASESGPKEQPQPVPELSEQPAPGKTETARHLGRLTYIDGIIYYKRSGGEKWFKAAEGTRLLAGASIDTRLGKALIEFDDGTVLCLNDHTVAALREDKVDLKDGEVYLDIRGRKQPLEVVTEHGTARHLGTKFSVKVTPVGTTVTVEEGTVLVSNKYGSMEVPAGYQTSVTRIRPPANLKRLNLAGFARWAAQLRRGGDGVWKSLIDGEALNEPWRIIGHGRASIVEDGAMEISGCDLFYPGGWDEFAFTCDLQFEGKCDENGAVFVIEVCPTLPSRGSARLKLIFLLDGDIHAFREGIGVFRKLGTESLPTDERVSVKLEVSERALKIYRKDDLLGTVDVSGIPPKKGGIMFYPMSAGGTLRIWNPAVRINLRRP